MHTTILSRHAQGILPIMFNLTKGEEQLYKRLSSPARIQDFLNSLPRNDDRKSDTLRSPRTMLKANKAHCFEGAFFAAAVLWFHGHAPIILDLKSKKHDLDHVVTLFKQNGYWGALSKTNHAVLRYREPVYKNIRELALSYFHEYFLDSGEKTMISYSRPFNLKKYGTDWITRSDDLWDIGADLDDSPHFSIVPKGLRLRKADGIEIKAGKLVD